MTLPEHDARMKKTAKKPKANRYVLLGEGHPFFWITSTGAGTISLYGGNLAWDKPLKLEYGDLGGHERIRLFAEVLR